MTAFVRTRRAREWIWPQSIGLALVISVSGLNGQTNSAWAQDTKSATTEAQRPTTREKLPTAGEVLDQAIEAMGGRAALEKLHSRISKGTITIEGESETKPITIYEAAPNKFYSVTEMPGVPALGKIEEGADGEVLWRMTAVGPTLSEGAERAARKRQTTFNNILHLRELYAKIECVGIEKVDDHECCKLVLTPAEGGGAPETSYYDRQTHLPVKTVQKAKAWGGDMIIEVFPSEYRKVDGVLLPHKVTKKNSVIHQAVVVTFDSIANNVEIPADRFALPEAVKKLLAGGKAETKSADVGKEKPGESK